MERQGEVKVVENLGDEEESGGLLEKYEITSYGADYPVDSLVARMKDGSIIVPQFQREYVWPISRASRFIESLLLGLPVPGIFLYKEDRTGRLVVVDGNQRLRTLQYFYEGLFQATKREFSLVGIDSEFKGLTYKSLQIEDKRTLDNSILHTTIIKQDKPSDDLSSVFHIFERLNTGGMLLQAQEIRSAIYEGGFKDLIKSLNLNEAWRTLYGKVSGRMRDQELILRFFALYYCCDKYEKPMRSFLNTYMSDNKNLSKQWKEQLTEIFTKPISVIDKCLGKKAFMQRGVMMAAIFDAVMVGIAKRLAKGSITDFKMLKEHHSRLLHAKAFKSATETHTSDVDKVKTRIKMSIKAFSDVK